LLGDERDIVRMVTSKNPENSGPGKPPGRREQRKQEVRNAVFGAAMALMEEKGYDSVTVDDIVRTAGVAKGTFFNYYPSKADLVADWYTRLVDETLRSYRPRKRQGLAARLAHLAQAANQLSRESPALWRAKNELALTTPAIQAAERAGDAAVTVFSRRIIEEAVVAGEVRPDTNVQAFAETYTSLVTGVVRQWLAGEQGSSLEALLRRRVESLCQLAQA